MTFRYVPNNPAWLSPDKDLNTLTAAGRCAYKYWLQIKLATPKWYDLEKAKAIYKEAAERGLQVDHIVPLNSSIVCGLNCPDNFQLITELQNSVKSNHYWPDMPNEPLTLPYFLLHPCEQYELAL